MAGPFLITLCTLLIAGACFQLSILLYKRYTRRYDHVEDDIETFAIEAQLQLQHEFQNAIQDGKTDANGSFSPSQVMIAQSDPERVGGDLFSYNLLQHSKEDHINSQKGIGLIASKQLAAHFNNQRPKFDGRADARMFDESPDSVALEDLDRLNGLVFVNAKQFHRILKRRETRKVLDEYLRSRQLGRKADLRNAGNQGCMRRPRGPTGRFLTAEEQSRSEILV